MADIRAVGSNLKDQDDDEAFQLLVGDVQRLKQEMRKGSTAGYGGTAVGGPSVDQTNVTITGGSLSDVTINSPTINNATFSPAISADIEAVFAYQGAAQTPSGITYPITFASTSYDPNGWWVSSLLFQPTIAGVYLLTASVNVTLGPSSNARVSFDVSGVGEMRFLNGGNPASINQSGSVSKIVTMNGTTDFTYLGMSSMSGTLLITPGGTFTAILLKRT